MVFFVHDIFFTSTASVLIRACLVSIESKADFILSVYYLSLQYLHNLTFSSYVTFHIMVFLSGDGGNRLMRHRLAQ